MTAMFGDLERLGLGHIEDLPTDGVCVTVGIRQRRATACAGGRSVIHDVVRVPGLRQGGSFVARLAAGWAWRTCRAGSACASGLRSSLPDRRWPAAWSWSCCRGRRYA